MARRSSRPAVSASSTSAGRVSCCDRAPGSRDTILRARVESKRAPRPATGTPRRVGPPDQRPRPGADQQRDDQVRRQVEHVRVADVVAEGEHDVRRQVAASSSAAVPPVAFERAAPAPRRRRAGPTIAELLPQIERHTSRSRSTHRSDRGTFSTIVSRQSDFVTSNQKRCSASSQAVRRIAAAARACADSSTYCSAPAAAQSARQRDDARREHRSPAARRAQPAGTACSPAPAGSSTGDCRSRARRRRRTTPAGRSSARVAHRSSRSSVSSDAAATCSAYTSAMTAWLQNVYDAGEEQRRADGRRRPIRTSSAATRTSRPHATRASTADARFSACAGSLAGQPQHEDAADRRSRAGSRRAA